MQALTARQDDAQLGMLFSGYIDICNRALAEADERFWFRQAKRFNRAVWGGAHFRTLIYHEDPDEVVAERTIHFDADERQLRVLPDGDHDVAFTWKVSTDYLEDVAYRRPDWYLEHPARLDWVWMKARVSDRISAGDTRSFAAGLVIGAGVGMAATIALAGALTARSRTW
jgi:hypothetical protein